MVIYTYKCHNISQQFVCENKWKKASIFDARTTKIGQRKQDVRDEYSLEESY